MKENYNQLKIEYSITDKESNSVRIMCVFLVLIFVLVPLAEIVTGLEYNTISHHSITTCLTGWALEPLTFKALQ